MNARQFPIYYDRHSDRYTFQEPPTPKGGPSPYLVAVVYCQHEDAVLADHDGRHCLFLRGWSDFSHVLTAAEAREAAMDKDNGLWLFVGPGRVMQHWSCHTIKADGVTFSGGVLRKRKKRAS
jgi:hypothetical protein